MINFYYLDYQTLLELKFKNLYRWAVFCNNSLVKSNYKVKPHDKISIRFEYEPYNKEIIPENIPLDIVFEDKDIVL